MIYILVFSLTICNRGDRQMSQKNAKLAGVSFEERMDWGWSGGGLR